jgi:uncharacterized protein (DUF1800 family)
MLVADPSNGTPGIVTATAPDPEWAWASYAPDDARPWNLRWAGHLHRRAGFGASWSELQRTLADGPQRTIDRLLRPETEAGDFAAALDDYEDAAARSGSLESLRAWWLRRMIQTPSALREKLTLFWHGHLGISHARVGDSRLMTQHVRTLRSHALGSYREMLTAVVGHPAFFLGLDAGANRRSQPNVNLARQVLDQYTVGPDKHDERDVGETARAFTGWFVLRGELRFFDREYDEGDKDILGQRGNWNPQDAVRIALEQRATPQRILRKLYRWLISETAEPDAGLLGPLVETFHKDYDITRIVETMLRSNLFFSPAAYRQRVKSPVEFAVGIVRSLEANVPTLRLGNDLADLGQDLYRPPTVKGWAGGRHWINTTTIVARHHLAAALFSEGGPYGGKLDPAAVAQRYGYTKSESVVDFLVELFLQGDLDNEARGNLADPSLSDDAPPAARHARQLAQRVACTPTFQLG